MNQKGSKVVASARFGRIRLNGGRHPHCYNLCMTHTAVLGTSYADPLHCSRTTLPTVLKMVIWHAHPTVDAELILPYFGVYFMAKR